MLSAKPAKEERLRFSVDYPPDTIFSAHARLLQSKWREAKGYPAGKYGNFIETNFAVASKVNFLTDKIRGLVREEIEKAKRNKGLIKEPRIWDNLLSSQPLCFNLFGELHYDLDLATRCFKHLFPGIVETVTAVKFEYSPGRGNAKYTGDHSAFDVFVEYNNCEKRGFIGIEVKYAESLREETLEVSNRNYKEIYHDLSCSCGIFVSDSTQALRLPPLSQIWRDHLLAISTRQDYDEGFFVFLHPANNSHCRDGITEYQKYLLSNSESENLFCPRLLEDFISAVQEMTPSPWAVELRKRYLGEHTIVNE